jgi:hypothetical protein
MAPEGTEIISGVGWGERPMIVSTDCYYDQSNVDVITNDSPGEAPYKQDHSLYKIAFLFMPL